MALLGVLAVAPSAHAGETRAICSTALHPTAGLRTWSEFTAPDCTVEFRTATPLDIEAVVSAAPTFTGTVRLFLCGAEPGAWWSCENSSHHEVQVVAGQVMDPAPARHLPAGNWRLETSHDSTAAAGVPRQSVCFAFECVLETEDRWAEVDVSEGYYAVTIKG